MLFIALWCPESKVLGVSARPCSGLRTLLLEDVAHSSPSLSSVLNDGKSDLARVYIKTDRLREEALVGARETEQILYWDRI